MKSDETPDTDFNAPSTALADTLTVDIVTYLENNETGTAVSDMTIFTIRDMCRKALETINLSVGVQNR